MAQRNLTRRPEAVYVVVVSFYSAWLKAEVEHVYGPYTKTGAKSAAASERRFNKNVRIERAETTWVPVTEGAEA